MAGNRAAYDAAMRQAEQHIQDQNWKGVIAAYKDALTGFPQDAAATLGIGEALIRIGQVDTALKALLRAVQLDPHNTRCLFALADVQERLGRLQGAAGSYTQIGDLEFQGGRLQAAVEAWTRAIQLAPDQVETYEKLAPTLERLGQTAKAAESYVTLAGIYERQQNLGAAIDACRQALRIDPNNQQLQMRLTQLGSAAVGQTGEFKLWDEEEEIVGETELEKRSDDLFLGFDSLSSEEDDGRHSPYDLARRQSLQEMANILFDADGEHGVRPEVAALITQAIDEQTRGLIQDAITTLRKAVGKGSTRTALIFNLGALYRDRGNFDNAIEAFRSAMRDRTYALGSHYGLALTYADAGKVDRASEHFLEVVKSVDLETVDTDRREALVAAYQQVRDNYAATVDSQRAITFVETVKHFFSMRDWPKNVPKARRNLDAVAEAGRIATLAEYLDRPETAVVVDTMVMTDTYIQNKLLRTALEECLYAIEKAPYNLSLHLRLGDVLLLQQQLPQAAAKYLAVADTCAVQGELKQTIELYERALKLTPMDTGARGRLIRLLLNEGRAEEAIHQYVALSEVQYQLAKLDLALKAYDDALALTWQSPGLKKWETIILYKKADIFSQRMDWPGATATYESIIAADPGDERALKLLADLYLKQRKPKKALQSLDALLATFNQGDRVQDMLAVMTELVEKHPTDVGLRARLAAMYARQGYTEDAVEQAEVLAHLQMQAGRREEAIRTVEILQKLAPTESQRFRRLMAEIEAHGKETDT